MLKAIKNWLKLMFSDEPNWTRHDENHDYGG
jgi:hypothetical protein